LQTFAAAASFFCSICAAVVAERLRPFFHPPVTCRTAFCRVIHFAWPQYFGQCATTADNDPVALIYCSFISPTVTHVFGSPLIQMKIIFHPAKSTRSSASAAV
jgi:hypothetical protein